MESSTNGTTVLAWRVLAEYERAGCNLEASTARGLLDINVGGVTVITSRRRPLRERNSMSNKRPAWIDRMAELQAEFAAVSGKTFHSTWDDFLFVKLTAAEDRLKALEKGSWLKQAWSLLIFVWHLIQGYWLGKQCQAGHSYQDHLHHCDLPKGHDGCHVDNTSGICWTDFTPKGGTQSYGIEFIPSRASHQGSRPAA